MTAVIVATCKVWSNLNRDWSEVATYEARDMQEAINWLKMMKDWSKDPRINGAPASLPRV